MIVSWVYWTLYNCRIAERSQKYIRTERMHLEERSNYNARCVLKQGKTYSSEAALNN
jgi:hypothetical protein